MNSAGAFSLDQLMELAGLACAQALATVYPLKKSADTPSNRRVLVCCGPGNQGKRVLVCCRPGNQILKSRRRWSRCGSPSQYVICDLHFRRLRVAAGMFGYSPTIFLPKVIMLHTDSSKMTEMQLAAWVEGDLSGKHP
jgi:hypothetical protein